MKSALSHISAFMFALCCFGSTHANVHQQSDDTTCYILKNDKLLQKSSCIYQEKVTEYGGYSGMFRMPDEDIKIDFSSIDLGRIKLNNEVAKSFIRSESTLEKLTGAQLTAMAESGETEKLIFCVKNSKNYELCSTNNVLLFVNAIMMSQDNIWQ